MGPPPQRNVIWWTTMSVQYRYHLAGGVLFTHPSPSGDGPGLSICHESLIAYRRLFTLISRRRRSTKKKTPFQNAIRRNASTAS